MLYSILGGILGVLMIAGGLQCCFNPEITVASIAAVIPQFLGITMFVSSVVRFVEWIDLKHEGGRDGFMFWESVLGIVFSLILLFNWTLRAAMALTIETLLPAVAAAMVLCAGINRIARSIVMKRANNALEFYGHKFKFSWGWELVLGILLVVLGILSACHPFVTGIGLGVFIGIDIIATGMMMIVSAFVIH